eukprot:811690-Pelagomonas_calceolata.AAC.8
MVSCKRGWSQESSLQRSCFSSKGKGVALAAQGKEQPLTEGETGLVHMVPGAWCSWSSAWCIWCLVRGALY